MLVAITGATGFVGSHIADELHRRGHRVRCLLRPSSNVRWIEGKPYERHLCSFDDTDSLKLAISGSDAVVHVAGVIAARSLAEFMDGNLGVTKRMLEATAQVAGSSFVRFLHVSSMAVCGPARSLEEPLDEDSPLEPITPYGISKKAAEEAVSAMSSTLPTTIVRPPAVYGERDEATLSFFRAVAAGIVPLIGFSPKWVSLVHVRDLARGIVDALESNATVGRTYFVSSDEFYTWKQIGMCTAAIMRCRAIPVVIPHWVVLTIAAISGWIGHLRGRAPVLDFHKGRDLIQRYWICSTDRARNDFGYRQNVPLDEGIADTVEWYISQGWIRQRR